MTGFLSVKMKRKDLEEIYDEFSDFSLSSPARKIRRLDAELPPIMEEEETAPLVLEQPLPEDPLNGTTQLAAPWAEEVHSLPLNEERALVLYKPVNTPLLQTSASTSTSTSNVSYMVNPEWLQGFKNQVFWSADSNVSMESDSAISEDKKRADASDCLAVIPWVSSQLPVTQRTEDARMVNESSQPMDAEDFAGATMEVEQDNIPDVQEVKVVAGMEGGEGSQQWQHCMTPQFPQNTSTPILW